MKNIKILVLDVDGTLTDGKIYIDSNGIESKSFHVKDGLAISQLISSGIECAIITGRTSKIVSIRAKELGIKYLYQGVYNKVDQLNSLLLDLGLTKYNCAYIGDDINDLDIIKMVSFSACPKDAALEIIKESDFVSKYNGGYGAVREIIEYILKEKNIWNDVVNNYNGSIQ